MKLIHINNKQKRKVLDYIISLEGEWFTKYQLRTLSGVSSPYLEILFKEMVEANFLEVFTVRVLKQYRLTNEGQQSREFKKYALRIMKLEGIRAKIFEILEKHNELTTIELANLLKKRKDLILDNLREIEKEEFVSSRIEKRGRLFHRVWSINPEYLNAQEDLQIER